LTAQSAGRAGAFDVLVADRTGRFEDSQFVATLSSFE